MGVGRGRWASLLVVGLPLGVVGAACGDDEPGSGSGDDEVGGVELEAGGDGAAVDEEPPATEAAEVQALVLDLLERYDEVTAGIVADPTVAADRDSGPAREFLDLFEPGSEFAEQSLDTWEAWGAEGISLRPLAEGELVNVTTLEGVVTPVSEDEVRFVQCPVQSYVRYDDGREVERVEGAVLPGEGTAVRVEGRWRLGELRTPPGMLGCGSGG